MTTPVLCRGIDSNGDVISMSLSASGEMNIAAASALSVSGNVTVDNFPGTQAVSAAALPLPAGASTSALQTTNTGAITAMSGKLPASLGQKTSATSLSVTMSNDEGVIDVNSVIASASSDSGSIAISGGASDTSQSKDTAGYTSVGVIVTSDQTDTKAGLEWSHDGVTYHAVEQGQAIPSVVGLGATENIIYFKVGVLAKYVRVHVKATTACSAKVLINLA